MLREGRPLLYGDEVTPEAPRARRILDRPGRIAAIGGAAVVCVLTVSGALGLSHTGLDASGPHQQTASLGAGERAGSGVEASGGPGTTVKHTPHDSSASGSTGADATTSDPKLAHRTTQGTALPANSGRGRRVVFDESAQRVWLVKADNSVERTYLVSGSKFDNLDKGTYHVYSRSRYATAYNSAETMDYMVRFTTSNRSSTPIGFHSIPALPNGHLAESRSELGAPASDGCIRQWITDARALWNFAPEGTTVVVRA
jgi:hypothetical protein